MKKTITIVHYNTWLNPPVPTSTLQETWEPLPDLFCPHCGKKEVWHDTGPGDYYLEEDHICRACGWLFNLPSLNEILDNPVDTNNQILTQLRKQ